MASAYSKVTDVLDRYFDGFYEGNVATLKQVFHPNCHLYSGTGGVLVDDDMEAVYKRVSNREAPAKRNEVRADRVISIHFSDSHTALATVEIGIGDKLFTDYLNFVNVGDDWLIISKVYTYVARQAMSQADAAE